MDPTQVQKQIDQSIDQAMSFSTAKFGDTPTAAQQLTPKGYVDKQITSVYSAIPSVQSIPSVFSFTYGDGSDGTVTLDGGNNYSFASITGASVYTATRDIYATNFTINSGVTYLPAQWRTFSSSTLHGIACSITAIGNKGGDASISGAGGAGFAAGYFPSTVAGTGGVTGGLGGVNGPGQNGNNGASPSVLTNSILFPGISTRDQSAIVGGNVGGTLGGNGGAAGGGGSVITSNVRPIPVWGTEYLLDILANGQTVKMNLNNASGGAAGGGGGASIANNDHGGVGGTGGGSGSPGGIIALYAKNLVLDATSAVSVKGGAGGMGGPGTPGTSLSGNQTGGGAGGGGGSGGNGGLILFVYNTASINGTLDYTGGTFGNGGTGSPGRNGGVTGGNGSAGFGGASGSVLQFQVT